MKNLDALRFVASAAIVLHHSVEFFFTPQNRPAVLLQTHGLALFVDLFFVISGFVIAHVYAQHVGSPADRFEFMRRRLGRLLPLHYATMIASILLWSGAVVLRVNLNHPPSFNPICIAETAFLLHSFIDCGGLQFNGVSWSISAEMVMYLAFPAFVLIAGKSKYAPIALGIGSLLMATYVASAGNIAFDASSWAGALPGPLRAFPSFAIGVGYYYCQSALTKIPHPRLVFFLAALAMIGAALFGAPAIAILAAIYVLTAAAVACDLRNELAPLMGGIAHFGVLTYSIYMIHLIVIMVVMNAVGDKLLHLSGAAMFPLAGACYILIFALAYYSYFYLETPARKWVNGLRFWTSRPRVHVQ